MKNIKGENEMIYEIECKKHNNKFFVKNPATKAVDICHNCKMER